MDYTRRIETPAEVAAGGDGPGWIELKTRIKGKYIRKLNRAVTLASQLSQVDMDSLATAGEAAQQRAVALAEQTIEASAAIYDVYAALVVSWNWRDAETGEPLPQPARNRAVFEEDLDQVQIGWLREQIQTLLKYRATEGNGVSGSA
jgi:hypothetical protein